MGGGDACNEGSLTCGSRFHERHSGWVLHPMLADAGADVIKVEPEGGPDAQRTSSHTDLLGETVRFPLPRARQ